MLHRAARNGSTRATRHAAADLDVEPRVTVGHRPTSAAHGGLLRGGGRLLVAR
jgi:hypothetical protein